MKEPVTLYCAYELVLGQFLSINPETYAAALDKMAILTHRVNDEQFKLDVYEVGKIMPQWDDEDF